MPPVELLSPAGSFETARAAFAAGADAVYLGLDAFSARAEAVNFSPDDLRQLLAFARTRGGKVYVTFNTLISDDEMTDAAARLALLNELHPDGLIVQDLGVARLVRRHLPELALHASTQLVAHNLEGVLALKELGFTRVVLARELPLDDIRSIARRSGVEIEVFVHGALCYSLSGLCLFSALEKDRSGNRGRCAYCCRLAYTDADGNKALPFSMRDLRLDDRLDALREAGVASLKIEGRMKSALYVASVTRHYRDLLDGRPPTVTCADLETVFSRRTTRLYIDGAPGDAPVVDPSSLGHIGTPIGTVKRLTKDREGRTWLRFHTARALERHDGLQFTAPGGGKPYGFGIAEMRTALSRHRLFAVPAQSDVEILVPAGRPTPEMPTLDPLQPGATVYCSASNEMKRRFPVPPFRPSENLVGLPVDVVVTLARDGLSACAMSRGVSVRLDAVLEPAQNPRQTESAIRKAFSRLGDTGWTLRELSVRDPENLFAPAARLNDLRRRLVVALDANQEATRRACVAGLLADLADQADVHEDAPLKVLKLRFDQPWPADASDFGEIVFAIGHGRGKELETSLAARCDELRAHLASEGAPMPAIRLALPVFTRERDFASLRATAKHMANLGMEKWEASDLATLRLLRAIGIDDITADWTLYAANAAARRELASLGVRRHVASPEGPVLPVGAAQHLATERLVRQSTPLFLSLTRPETPAPSRLVGLNGDVFAAYLIDGLWVTARPSPRVFPAPPNAIARTDLSWDAPA